MIVKLFYWAFVQRNSYCCDLTWQLYLIFLNNNVLPWWMEKNKKRISIFEPYYSTFWNQITQHRFIHYLTVVRFLIQPWVVYFWSGAVTTTDFIHNEHKNQIFCKISKAEQYKWTVKQFSRLKKVQAPCIISGWDLIKTVRKCPSWCPHTLWDVGDRQKEGGNISIELAVVSRC